MTWPDEVRAVDSPDLGSVKLTAKEKDLAATLVDHMTGDFDAEEFEDEYQVQLRQLIEAKLEAGDAVDTAATFGESEEDRKSTRLNSSHVAISYAVFCLKKKKNKTSDTT